MTGKRSVARKIFSELNGRAFQNHGDLEKVIVEYFNKYLSEFPPRYYYTHLMEFAKTNGWLRKEGNIWVIFYDEE